MNMRKVSCFILVVLFFNNSYTQPIDAGFYTRSNYSIITGHADILKTLTPVTIDSVLTDFSQKAFKRAPNKSVLFNGYDPYNYWFRFVINNRADTSVNLMLMMGPIAMKKGGLFQKRDMQWKQVAREGLDYPFEERSYQSAHYVFPFSTAANTLDTIYLNVDASNALKSFGFGLMRPSSLKAFENEVYFQFGIIIGLLLLFCTFNLYLYFALKDNIQLWYSLYILLLCLILMKNDQLDQQFLGWDSQFVSRLTSLMGVGAIAMAVLIHVIQKFLSNITKDHILYKISTIIKINTLVSGICHIIVFMTAPGYQIQNIVFNWADKSTILAIFVIIIDCIYSIIKGYRNAFFILAGMLVFLIGAIQRLMMVSTSSYMFPPSVFHIGMVLETLIISFGLVYRYRIDRKEKYMYLKEKETLKINFDKMLLESKNEIQEQTLKNIAQEIHDNIGQILSVIKINLFRLKAKHEQILETPLNDTINLLSKAIADLRSLSKKLDTDYVKEMGLVNSVSYELHQIERMCGLNTALSITGEPYRIESRKELILFRIYQEVINNIIKHANANRISVNLNFTKDRVELDIADDGKGFDIASINKPEGEGGLGLRNMQNRSNLIGAKFSIASNNHGTSIHMILPVDAYEKA